MISESFKGCGVTTARDGSDDDKIICMKAGRDCEAGLQLLREKDNVPVVSNDDSEEESDDGDADEEMLTSANTSEIDSSETENEEGAIQLKLKVYCTYCSVSMY